MADDENIEFLFGVEKSASGASWITPKNYQENIKDLFVQEFNISEILARLLVIRNYNINEAKDFLNPKILNLMPDPLTLIDMDKTIERLTIAVNKKETICFCKVQTLITNPQTHLNLYLLSLCGSLPLSPDGIPM